MTRDEEKPPGMATTARHGVAQVIAAILKAHTGLDLPVRLRAWDGSEAGPAERAGAPIAVIRSPQAIRRIVWHPGELGLARAYISGDLDVEGDLTEGLRLVMSAIRNSPARASAPRSARAAEAAPAYAAEAAPADAAAAPAEVTRVAARIAARIAARGRAAVPAALVPARVPVALAPVARAVAAKAAIAWTAIAWTPGAVAATRAALAFKILGPPWSPPRPPDCELRVSGRLHSRARDQAVIAGHYDVSAAFYQLILDPNMAYSCAWWGEEDPGPGRHGHAKAVTLADAQRAKLEMICGKLAVAPGSTLLDMGCGWGSLTVHAARDHRAKVKAVTLSQEQGGYVRQRVRGLGLAERAQVRVQDYRDEDGGPYDAIASVEMGEHVGAANYPRFCAELHRLLRPGGRLLIQQMSRGARAPGGGPFIESYITPDMTMRPVGETVRLIEDAGFEVIGVQAMRPHYVRTIRAWLDNFEAKLPEVEAILTPEQVRVWRLYLAGGALAFEEGRMGVDQILAVRRG